MILAIFAILTTGVAAALVYSALILLSHQPRDPFPAELKYSTNDEHDKLYDLPRRTDSSSAYEDHGIDISVVVPCFNETQRLGKMLDESIAYLQQHYLNKYEILIVDDGSRDGTDRFAISKANEHKLPPHIVRVVQLTQNRGKGGAVTHGLLHARGKLALFADADGATKFSDIGNLAEYLNHSKQPAIAIGSRAHMVNTDAVVKRSFVRNFLMYGLHTLVFIFGIRGVKDTQCGFKMFNFEAIKRVFPHMHTERWIFDVEILLLAELQKIPVKEFPVNWHEVDGSKVNIATDSIDMAIDLVVTRLAYLLGIYKLDECKKLSKKRV